MDLHCKDVYAHEMFYQDISNDWRCTSITRWELYNQSFLPFHSCPDDEFENKTILAKNEFWTQKIPIYIYQ